jgi:hypothetical protein
LTRLRAETEPLRRGALVQLLAEEQVYAFARKGGSGSAVVVINNAPRAAEVDLDVGAVGLPEGARLVDGLGALPAAEVRDGRLRAALPPRSAGVYVEAR